MEMRIMDPMDIGLQPANAFLYVSQSDKGAVGQFADFQSVWIWRQTGMLQPPHLL